MKEKPKKPLCERCSNDLVVKVGERFCKQCKSDVMQELRDSAYLTKVPMFRPGRSTEQKENTNETKHGTGHG